MTKKPVRISGNVYERRWDAASGRYVQGNPVAGATCIVMDQMVGGTTGPGGPTPADGSYSIDVNLEVNGNNVVAFFATANKPNFHGLGTNRWRQYASSMRIDLYLVR